MSNLKTAKAPSFKRERRTHSHTHIIMLLKWLVRCSHANWGNYVRKHTILWWFNFSTRKTHTHLHIMYCGTKKITRLWAEVESKTQKPKTTFHLSSFELGSVRKRANFGNFCRSSLRDDHVNAKSKSNNHLMSLWMPCLSANTCVFEFHSSSWRGNLAQRQIWLRRVELQ